VNSGSVLDTVVSADVYETTAADDDQKRGLRSYTRMLWMGLKRRAAYLPG